MSPQANLVTLGSGTAEQAGFFSTHVRNMLFQFLSRLTLVVDVVPEMTLAHGGEHAFVGNGNHIRPKVCYGRELCSGFICADHSDVANVAESSSQDDDGRSVGKGSRDEDTLRL